MMTAPQRAQENPVVHHIDYYFATVSPWMYLGHERFVALARQHGATIAVKP